MSKIIRQTDRQTETDRQRRRETERHTDRQRQRETDRHTVRQIDWKRQTDRQTDSETDSETDRQTDRQTDRWRDRETETDRQSSKETHTVSSRAAVKCWLSSLAENDADEIWKEESPNPFATFCQSPRRSMAEIVDSADTGRFNVVIKTTNRLKRRKVVH